MGTGRSSTLGDLAATGEVTLRGDPAVVVTRIGCELGQVGPGTLYAPLGPQVTASELEAAVARGASALLVRGDPGLGVPVLLGDPLATLGPLAAAHERRPAGMGVIGITGTDGKTTTALLVTAVLEAAGIAAGSVTTVGVRGTGETAPPTRLTTPEAPELQRHLRRMHEAGARWAVVEATSHALELGRLRGTDVAVACVTNVTHEHLDFHGSTAAYRRAKGRLVRMAADAGGVVVLDADDEGARSLEPLARGARLIRCSADGAAGAGVRAGDIRCDAAGSSFTLVLPDGEDERVRLRLPGRFNVGNALCAAGVAYGLGVAAERIAAGLSGAASPPGRMTRVEAGQPYDVVIDYAHTPAALAAVLRHLRSVAAPGGRLIVVLGSAGERDLLKRPWLGDVATRWADLAVLTVEDPRGEDPADAVDDLAVGARAAGGQEGRTFVRVLDRRAAIRHAFAAAGPGDCVLLAGKGHERTIEWADGPRPWDETGTALELLAAGVAGSA